jgi:tRNA (mo5U34)-methyltransferase
MTASAQDMLEREVREVAWYHTMRLPRGIVTPGNFNTLEELEKVPLPSSLAGRRCLDVGTADGFWAFEMERRGAEEVVAVDVHDPQRMDWPGVEKTDAEMRSIMGPELNRHRGFQVAHRALESSVRWEELSVYELDPGSVGTFDFIFMGSLLLHLRDPVAALQSIRSVLTGQLLSVDAISPLLSVIHPHQPIARLEAPGWPMWWTLNLRAYRRLFEAAGLEIARAGRPFTLPRGPGYGSGPRSPRPVYHRFQQLVLDKIGIPHAWVLARSA